MIVYLAHPVRPIDGETYGKNLELARLYLRAMIQRQINAIAPWLQPLLLGWVNDSDERARELGLRQMHAIAARCDVIALCGPRVSPGMLAEMRDHPHPIPLTGLTPYDAARKLRKYLGG